MTRDVDQLPYAYGSPPLHGVLRRAPEDFQVDEDLGFVPSGEGEHVLVHVRKRGMNTAEVARLLARHAGVPPREVSYAGLKDRHAVTSQWFSVSLPGKTEPEWSQINDANLTVIATARHRRKLRRGALTGKRFTLVVHEFRCELTSLPERLRRVAAECVPNYFGEQRFGRENIARARRMLAGTLRVRDRFERGMYLSALRSQLFNEVLACRCVIDTCSSPVCGDVMMLDGSRSFFVAETVDEVLLRRVAEHDIHPSGPLWGRGELHSRHDVRAMEEYELASYDNDREVLADEGLEMERRPLRLVPQDLQWDLMTEAELQERFALSPGAYATVVMRELLRT